MNRFEQHSKEIEAIVRPIVEGQIRGFIKEHPSILKGVDWYKPRADKALTLTNSLSKRIVRDLVCEISIARLGAVFVELHPASRPISPVAGPTAGKWRCLARKLGSAIAQCFTGNA